MERRRTAIKGALAEAGCDHLVFCGANRFGSGVQWLTGWPVTTEAVGLLTPERPDALFIQYHNHVPLARRLAGNCDVHWGEQSSIRAAAGELAKRSAKANKVGYIGPLTADQHDVLAARFGIIKNLNKSYVRLRMMKSAEELDWLRIGAHFSDLGMAALRDGLQPGLTERELGDLVERAYVAQGGTNVIHYFGVTPMRDPQIAVPAQFPSIRQVRTGDVVFAEISAAFWDYPGQVLRSFAVGEEPTSLYRALHAAARGFVSLAAH
jgi:Xaa-Pro dipeptidase